MDSIVFQTFALTFAMGGIAYCGGIAYACFSMLRIEAV